MNDRLTPMEAEVQELLEPRHVQKPGDFYGTAAQPKPRRSYAWFWVTVGLLVIGLSTYGVVAALFNVQVIHRDGDWRLAMRNQEETRASEETMEDLAVPPVENYQPSNRSQENQISLRMGTESDQALTPAQIYAQAGPGVVCVQAQSYYGSVTYTGVVASGDGFILTASDGLSGALGLTVIFPDGQALQATRLGEDRVSGLAVLKVDARNLPALSFAEDGNLQVGDTAYCISNPYGTTVPNVFSEGMLSARQEVELNRETYTLLQFSGSGQTPGWGCPILNDRGQVVALTTPIGQRLVSGTDPCFALTVTDLTQIINRLAAQQTGDGLWLGLTVEEIPQDYGYLGFPGSLWITDVAVGSQAYGVLCGYDVITAVNGAEVSTVEEYQAILDQCSPGDRVRLTIYRSNKWYTILLPVLER